MTEATLFSATIPKLQLAWDASSLKALQFCPRYYQYSILEGWRGESVHLGFGGLLATGLEVYQTGRVHGLSREDALIPALRQVMLDSWYEDGTQWGGEYRTQWRCTGTEKYKNAKGNTAKCPWSKAHEWFDTDPPHICGSCGSPIETAVNYLPGHPSKNRKTLVRSLIWYAFNQPEDLDKGLRPFVFPNGELSIELHIPPVTLPWMASTGESYTLTGHVDYIGSYGGLNYIVDNKSTDKPLDARYFNAFSPDTQFDTYDMILPIVFPDVEFAGIMVDAIQTQVGGTQFGRRIIEKDEDLRQEHFEDLKQWLAAAHRYALADYWPMNKRNCWLCPFKKICSLNPKEREAQLEYDFTKREQWNPLIPRN